MAEDDASVTGDGATLAEQHQPPPHLATRVVSALILIPVALAAVWMGGIWFAALLGLGGFLMSMEWASLIDLKGLRLTLFAVLSALIAAGFVASAGAAPDPRWTSAVLGLGAVAALVGFLTGNRRLGWVGLGLVYCWTPVYALSWLRASEHGLWWVAWVLLVVWGTDIGAYFVGRAVGGARLVPHISPNKTWSGLVGGMVLAAVIAAVAAEWFTMEPVLLLALAAAGLAVVAQAGDIVESAVKRHFGKKDSGWIIPGHGGILDRVDGLVFVTPLVAAVVAFGS